MVPLFVLCSIVRKSMAWLVLERMGFTQDRGHGAFSRVAVVLASWLILERWSKSKPHQEIHFPFCHLYKDENQIPTWRTVPAFNDSRRNLDQPGTSSGNTILYSQIIFTRHNSILWIDHDLQVCRTRIEFETDSTVFVRLNLYLRIANSHNPDGICVLIGIKLALIKI